MSIVRRVRAFLRPPARIPVQPRELWRDRGFVEREPGLWWGKFLTPYGRFEGFIVEREGRVKVYLRTRFPEADDHPDHPGCLAHDYQYGDFWQLHHRIPPQTRDQAIFSMENFIATACANARAKAGVG